MLPTPPLVCWTCWGPCSPSPSGDLLPSSGGGTAAFSRELRDTAGLRVSRLLLPWLLLPATVAAAVSLPNDWLLCLLGS